MYYWHVNTSLTITKRCDWTFDITMMTSSNGNILRVTGHLCEEFTGEFPAQRPVTRSFEVFFDLHPNKRLSKQWGGWWFETPPRSLWRHRNDTDIIYDFNESHWSLHDSYINSYVNKMYPATMTLVIFNFKKDPRTLFHFTWTSFY